MNPEINRLTDQVVASAIEVRANSARDCGSHLGLLLNIRSAVLPRGLRRLAL
jgi:hypothetical protein